MEGRIIEVLLYMYKYTKQMKWYYKGEMSK